LPLFGCIMPRKKVAEMTPDELEAHRAYNREAKRKSRVLV